MDLFTYYEPSRVWICKPCQFAVPPRHLQEHLRTRHSTHPTATTGALRQDTYQRMSKRPWLDPTREPCIYPDAGSPPIPHLPVYTGYQCPRCRYIVRAPRVLFNHIRKTHPELGRPVGRQCTTARSQELEALYRGQPPEYLGTCNLAAAADLSALPDPGQEPLLVLLAESVERLIQRSYRTIKDRRINEFDQVTINTFLTQRPKIWDRPIQIHLKPTTYASYRRVWQRLICFIYRTSRPDQTVLLRHQFTSAQLAALDRMVEAGTRLLRRTRTTTATTTAAAAAATAATAASLAEQERLDRACLDLSIALLDHPLKGELYESALVGFLAVLGIDPQRRTFRDPYSYTHYLSGLVKIAQILVAEQAVALAERGDDEQTLSYRDLRLSMTGLRDFVRTQIELAQQSLENLFLLHNEETRGQIVPVLPLEQLQDDPVNNTRGWNFLQHPRNGKPGRETELISLRHSNTLHGRHRNIFIKHGLVSTVTSYHKGYSISNSTKIIHRYLPKPISELLVYYLWLILPFWQAIQRLTHRSTGPRSSFLWPKATEGTWDPSRLRTVLQREAAIHLQTKLNVASYRHAAIAISRVHLKCGGFKRDYGTDSAAFDEQASHGTWAAGTVYARGLQEAPGHVEERRRQYRAISREWHQFLGFAVSLGPRKRPAEDPPEGARAKRTYISIEMEKD
ncbi:predicted protein [Aspergillus terreus NIH2624]|uniref:C2H2-type domain-containing protein n=1 Tax=Aspergillus terreus (strain NIH 2624 / FGSC A1156) TaxID=341663 RepID=Q0CCU7_ASPTN|nr:uncharacterized protein ATEG_08487 [Aspergillus terreus NIH2624]EAU31660.1 predicted protein [Aspergillus terreus NIH2624]